MCLQIVSESLTSIVMVKIYCSEMFRTWIKIRCLFQDRFVKTFLFIIPSLSRPWITNISCFGETTTKFNIHTNIWIWHWASIQVKPIPSSIENYLFQIWKNCLTWWTRWLIYWILAGWYYLEYYIMNVKRCIPFYYRI